MSLAQRAKEVLPEDPWISDTLGWIFYRKGLYPTAIRLLREALEQGPHHPTIHYHLGLAYRKHGEGSPGEAGAEGGLVAEPGGGSGRGGRRLLGEMGEGFQPQGR